MQNEEFGRIVLQIKNYCNCEMNDDQLAAYKAVMLYRDYTQVNEAVQLAYTGGYLDEYIKRRNIPSPNIFEQFYHNIKRREETRPAEPEEISKTPVGALFLAIIMAGFEARKNRPKDPAVFAGNIRELWKKTGWSGEYLAHVMGENVADTKREEIRAWMMQLIEEILKTEQQKPAVIKPVLNDVPF